MDHSTIFEMNEFLVSIFNEILLIEETSLKMSEFSDLSIKEMHTIEAIISDFLKLHADAGFNEALR